MYKQKHMYMPLELDRIDLVELVDLLKVSAKEKPSLVIQTTINDHDLRFASLEELFNYSKLPDKLETLHMWDSEYTLNREDAYVRRKTSFSLTGAFPDISIESTDDDADWVRGRFALTHKMLESKQKKDNKIASLFSSNWFHVLVNGWLLAFLVRAIASLPLLLGWLLGSLYVWYIAKYISRAFDSVLEAKSVVWLVEKPKRYLFLKNNALQIIELVLLFLTVLIALISYLLPLT